MSSFLLPGGVLTGRKTLRHQRMPTNKEAFEMCQGFADFLGTLYPGYIWRVQMQGDLVEVMNLNITKRCGFRVPLKDIDAEEGRVLMRAGGELLERYKLKRGKRNDEQVKALKRDIRGDAIQ